MPLIEEQDTQSEETSTSQKPKSSQEAGCSKDVKETVDVLFSKLLTHNAMMIKTFQAMDANRKRRCEEKEINAEKRFKTLDEKISKVKPEMEEVRDKIINLPNTVGDIIKNNQTVVLEKYKKIHTQNLDAQTETIVATLKGQNVKFAKTIQCDTCKKKFVSAHALKQHEKEVHFPTRKFKRLQMICEYENCNVMSRIPAVMTNHTRSHCNGRVRLANTFFLNCPSKGCSFSTCKEKVFLSHLKLHKLLEESPEVQALMYNLSVDDNHYLTKHNFQYEKSPSEMWEKNPLQ